MSAMPTPHLHEHVGLANKIPTKPNMGTKQPHQRLRAGTSIVRQRPCFSLDSKYLFIPADNGVRVYVVETSACLHNLFADHDDVVSCFINPKNELQLITVSSDGYICFWNYEDAVLVRQFHSEGSISAGYPHPKTGSVYLIKKEKCGKAQSLVLVNLNRNENLVSEEVLLSFIRTWSTKLVALSTKCDQLAVAEEKRIFIYDIATGQQEQIRSPHPVVCVVWHPRDECLASGDNYGRITLWFKKHDGSHTLQVFHFHSGACQDIRFSFTGLYFYSIGLESLLVKWNPQSGTKHTTTRMGMPQCYIECSVKNNYVAVSHLDNSISIVDVATSNVRSVIQGLAISHPWDRTGKDPVPTGMLFDPRTGCLVLNGRTGHLQFYNLFEDKQLYSLDITQANYVSEVRDTVGTVFHLQVIKAAFDFRGNWLATVEYWNDGQTAPIIRLKFWHFSASQSCFIQNTCVEYPHNKVVRSLLFQPRISGLDDDQLAPLAITTGEDKQIRFWHLVKEEANQVTQYVWSCAAVGTYCNLCPSVAGFSEDGSVLAVAFDNNLTLWDTASKELRSNLAHPLIDDIKQVVFGRQFCSHLIVCTTLSSLNVWDTLSLSVLWRVQNGISYLAGDLVTENMAAFSTSSDLYVFKPNSAEPLFIHKNVCNEDVIAATFIPQRKLKREGSYVPWLEKSELIFMSDSQKLFTLCTEGDQPESSNERVAIQRNVPLTPFGLLMAENQKSGVEKVEQKFHQLVGCSHKKIIKEILSTPAQVLPAPADLCKTILNSLLIPLNDRSRTLEDDESDESDVDSGHESHSSNEGSDIESSNVANKKDRSVRATDHKLPVDTAAENVSAGHLTDLKNVLSRVAKEDYKWLVAPT